jgi:hypothetical protein
MAEHPDGNGAGHRRGCRGVRLEAIQFNHDPTSATNDALSIRRNATTWVDVPEWRQGISVNPEDSPAAYAIRPTQGQTLTILASFGSSTLTPFTAEIRAIDNVVDPPGPGGCIGWLLALIRALLRALFGNVLGEVQARQVAFTNGASGFVPFDLVHTRLSGASVGTHTTEWRWQCRARHRGAWKDLQVTRHRVYVVLDLPTAPWEQAPYDPSNLQLPWTEVLDRSCAWALGTATVDDAAAAVTRSVNDLGPSVITYDCPTGGSSYYSWASYAGNTFVDGAFSCTAFLDRLQGGPGNGVRVNCSDCATIVSTFANVLGCDLWQSRMGVAFFHLNDILAIGSSVWQPPCQGIDSWAGGFGYHEVAWEGGCTANDDVFDACLQVDGDADPTDKTSHTPLLPQDLRFGNPGDMQYRDRLTVPADRANCSPVPSKRGRRRIT